MDNKESHLPFCASALPLVGVAGTVAGIILAFVRIDNAEPIWRTTLQAAGSAWP
jgi:biopolymer transport protein ExbB/TolQ